ncbi:MAG: phytase [Xanthomonadaceae bacterium]|nr:phytase [Xanthomonadaceae bacterium]
MLPRYRPLFCAAALLVACLLPASLPAATPARIAEAWTSAASAGEEMDSLAVWHRPDGGRWLIATAKDGQRLLVFDADTGARIGASGGPGTGPGQFRRPNGIAVAGDLLFVVERDGARVQVLRLPGFEPVGQFGQDQLLTPYGIWLDTREAGAVTAYVTDSFMADFANRVLPPRERLAERVKRYRLAVRDGRLEARYLGAFGDTGEAGALRMVESIAGDVARGRLLVADEDYRTGSTLREYSLQGQYLGRSLPAFTGDAEGVVLWPCGEGGYWIAADQVDPTRFRVFERDTLAPAGEFSGERTAMTDGVALAGPSARFPHGVLYALHADSAVSAFDLGTVAQTLQLAPACRP